MKTILFFLLLTGVTAQSQQNSRYKVIAYYTGSGAAVHQFELNKLTHIIYSFLKMQNDTLLFRDSAQEENVKQLVALKKDFPALKIMVSVGGWGG